MGDYELVYCGSALKICWVARGRVDFYPRFGPTYEWDTAAGHCILEQVGGQLLSLEAEPLKYNFRKTLINRGFFAIHSDELLPFLVDKSS